MLSHLLVRSIHFTSDNGNQPGAFVCRLDCLSVVLQTGKHSDNSVYFYYGKG